MDHYTALKKQPKKKDRTCYKDVSSLCVIYTSTYTEHIVHGIYRVACMCIHTQICICTCMYVYKTFFPRTMIKSWENISNNSTHKTISQHGRAKKRRLRGKEQRKEAGGCVTRSGPHPLSLQTPPESLAALPAHHRHSPRLGAAREQNSWTLQEGRGCRRHSL